MDPTAAPTELTINGTTYKAYPLRDIDHETYNKWVRREYIRRIKDSISDDEDLSRLALSQVATMSWMSGDGLRVAMTVAGLHKLASLLCRTDKIPLEEVADEEVLERIYEVYKELHPFESEEKTSKSESTDPK